MGYTIGSTFGTQFYGYFTGLRTSKLICYKKFSEAYNSNYSNSGIIQGRKKGDAIFRVLCPQPYKQNSIKYMNIVNVRKDILKKNDFFNSKN